MIKFKEGTTIKRLTSQMVLALNICDQILAINGYDCIITAGDNGNHMSGSLHPLGLAFDLRSKHISSLPLKLKILSSFKDALGNNYDVLLERQGLENEHYHIEYDPK